MSATLEIKVTPQQLITVLTQMSEQEQVDFVSLLFQEPRCRNVIETVEDYLAVTARQSDSSEAGRPLSDILREMTE
jgi:hypothetical protein